MDATLAHGTVVRALRLGLGACETGDGMKGKMKMMMKREEESERARRKRGRDPTEEEGTHFVHDLVVEEGAGA